MANFLKHSSVPTAQKMIPVGGFSTFDDFDQIFVSINVKEKYINNKSSTKSSIV